MILNVFLLHFLLFPWLFPSYMIDDLPTSCLPVSLLARSQSCTVHVSLAFIFPSCFRSSYLPFPWYIRSQYFPQYVFAISPHPYQFNRLSAIIFQACTTLVVPRLCSFLTLFWHGTLNVLLLMLQLLTVILC